MNCIDIVEQYRRMRGVTISELCKMSGLPYSVWKQRRYPIILSEFKTLMKALGYTISADTEFDTAQVNEYINREVHLYAVYDETGNRSKLC